jgi:hypothetical protein
VGKGALSAVPTSIVIQVALSFPVIASEAKQSMPADRKHWIASSLRSSQ